MNMSGVGGRLYRIASTLLFLVVCLTSCASTAGVFGGGKWQSGGLQHQQLLSLAVGPNNPQVIYAGDAQNGVFESTNAGMNWRQQSSGLPLPITIFAIAFDDPGKKLYAATNSGVFVSVDPAIHWEKLNGLSTEIYTSVVFDLNAPHIIYVASEHHGVYMSMNDGSSWVALNNGLPSDIIIQSLTYDSVEHVLWAATSHGIYRYDNEGVIWQVQNDGLPSQISVNTILPAASIGGDKGLIFAGTNYGFFLSHNNGAHWSQSQESLAGTKVNAIIIDYHTVTTVYAGTGIGVLRSEDNGQNWDVIASGLPRDQPVQALAIGANGYNQLYAAMNGIYIYPGNSSVFDPSQILPLLLILAFFFALYRFSTRGRRRSVLMLQTDRKRESEQSPAHDNSQTIIGDNAQTDGRLPEGKEPQSDDTESKEKEI